MVDRGKTAAPSTPGVVELDLEGLFRLAHDDPEAFERERRRLIDACIARQPAADHAMLRRLQFRADGTRRRCRTALQSSLRLSDMMWAAFHELNARLNGTESPAQALAAPRTHRASVLYLPRRGTRRGTRQDS